MPNMGKNAKANIEAVVNLMEPFHKVIKRQVSKITEGIEIIIVVVWKKVATVELMPVRYMWCAQTMKDRNPRTNTAPIMILYPQSGLRELLHSISATIPIAGKIKTYTSGCPKNQNKCCHKSGLPPPETAMGVDPVSNTPDGRKKLVSQTRSMSCMIPAASRGGNASKRRKAVTNWAQTKNGIRNQVIPGERS